MSIAIVRDFMFLVCRAHQTVIEGDTACNTINLASLHRPCYWRKFLSESNSARPQM